MNPWETDDATRPVRPVDAPVPGASRLRAQWLLFALAVGYIFGNFLASHADPIFYIVLSSMLQAHTMDQSHELAFLQAGRMLIVLVTIGIALLFGFGQGSAAVRHASLSPENLAHEHRRASTSLVVAAIVFAVFVAFQVLVFVMTRAMK